MKQSMKYKKSTKGTHVFEATESSEEVIIPTLYIKRTAFKEPVKNIVITIEVSDAN